MGKVLNLVEKTLIDRLKELGLLKIVVMNPISKKERDKLIAAQGEALRSEDYQEASRIENILDSSTLIEGDD